MDALGDLLDGVHARTAAFCRSVLEPPWSMRIADEAPLALATTLRGEAWIVPDHGEPTLLRTGDIAVLKGPAPYTVADHPDTPPSLIVRPGNRLTTLDGTDVTDDLRLSSHTSALGPRDGSVPGAAAVRGGLAARGGEAAQGGEAAIVASGTYQVTGDVSGRLLSALPAVVRVPYDDVRSPIMDLLALEVSRDEPGQQAVLDRLLDLALIATLRAWFRRPEADAPGWYRAHGDPLIGPALRAIHGDPARPWTVVTLAALAGASRAAFARRFTTLVGQPPMAYVTQWRLDLAADLLRDTDATVGSVARQVGYANAFAFTVAFKRVRGVNPRQHRTAAPVG